MSISARNWAWESNNIRDPAKGWRALTPGEKLTLLCLADLENAEYGYAFPSQKHIATRTCQGERSVRRNIDLLAGLGIVKVDRQRSRAGVWEHSVYYLNVPASYRENDPEWVRFHGDENPVDFFETVAKH